MFGTCRFFPSSETNATQVLCVHTGILGRKEMSIDVKDYGLTLSQFAAQAKRWSAGMVAQEAFPTIPAGIREFFISGMTPEAWDKMFPGE